MIIATHSSEWIKEQSVQALTINLYLPIPEDTEVWACRVKIDFEKNHDSNNYGSDSFQSLKLGIGLVRILINGFITSGWKMAVRLDNGSIAAINKEEMGKYINALF